VTVGYAEFKRAENTRITRERDRRRGRELATLLLAGVPLALTLLAYTALHVETVRLGYMREARIHKIERLREDNRRLIAALAAANSPERAARVAARRGFITPNPGQVLYPTPERGK
jgi:hypothetical protein